VEFTGRSEKKKERERERERERKRERKKAGLLGPLVVLDVTEIL